MLAGPARRVACRPPAVTVTTVFAAAAAVAGVIGAWDALAALERVPVNAGVARLLDPLRHAGRDGRPATPPERRRLAIVVTGALMAAAWLITGPVGGMLAAVSGPAIAMAIVSTRRRRYARELQSGAAEAARAMADAAGAGQFARGALIVAAQGIGGATGRELQALAGALELGDTTERALERLRARARCPAWDALTAGILLQRDAGGDLAGLLRRLAASLEAGDRLAAEARTATAQARFTAWLVVGLPFAAAGLAELAAPGMLAGLLSQPLSASLTAMALALQLVAIVCVRRIARPPRSA